MAQPKSSYQHPLKGSTSVIYKKPAPSKASSSKPSKPASQVVKPSSSKYSKMTPAERNANTLAGIKESVTKYTPKPSNKKPAAPKAPAKAPAKPAKPATVKTPAKTPAAVKPAPAAPAKAPAAKTVSQVWKEKTGMDWSEAKKLGVSDGSAKSNMALLAKLNSGATSRADLGVKVEPIVLATKKNEPMATPELETKRKGGATKMKKKYRMGGMKKKSC
jgi:hypothetical protein